MKWWFEREREREREREKKKEIKNEVEFFSFFVCPFLIAISSFELPHLLFLKTPKWTHRHRCPSPESSRRWCVRALFVGFSFVKEERGNPSEFFSSLSSPRRFFFVACLRLFFSSAEKNRGTLVRSRALLLSIFSHRLSTGAAQWM